MERFIKLKMVWFHFSFNAFDRMRSMFSDSLDFLKAGSAILLHLFRCRLQSGVVVFAWSGFGLGLIADIADSAPKIKICSFQSSIAV